MPVHLRDLAVSVLAACAITGAAAAQTAHSSPGFSVAPALSLGIGRSEAGQQIVSRGASVQIHVPFSTRYGADLRLGVQSQDPCLRTSLLDNDRCHLAWDAVLGARYSPTGASAPLRPYIGTGLGWHRYTADYLSIHATGGIELVRTAIPLRLELRHQEVIGSPPVRRLTSIAIAIVFRIPAQANAASPYSTFKIQN